jgi:hypothetical protein
MENEFHRYYKERVIPALQELRGYKNVHQIPKVEKVVINTSIGSQSDVKQALEEAKAELALITGQRPVETLQFQITQRSGDWREGDLARRADVRISGAFHQGRSPAHS